jgi:hypothetical protein
MPFYSSHNMSTLARLVYVSVRSPKLDQKSLPALLGPIRKKNAALGISGILLSVDDSFFQILEGEPEVVASLYTRIEADDRHTKLLKLIVEPIEARDFNEWSMGLAQLTRKELDSVPGLNDFFQEGTTLSDLSDGRARSLLTAFRDGRWRSRIT